MRWFYDVRYWLAFFLIFSCGFGAAHQTKLSSSLLTLEGGVVNAEIEVNVVDLEVALDEKFLTSQSELDEAAIENLSEEIFDYIANNNRLFCATNSVDPTRLGRFRVDGEHLVLAIQWVCDGVTQPSRYSVSLFQEIDTQSRHVVSIEGDQNFVKLLSLDDQSVSFETDGDSLWDLVIKFVISGVEHIAIGFDHIAFLLAVIVLGRSFWPLFKVVTAFTIAHSITLTLAVLNVFVIPPDIVEPLIALSIVYVAIENFFVKDIARRYWVTFIFGLIHGFGFASVLRDFGLPQEGLIWALASFNLGVEVGQLLIVLAAVIFWRLITSSSFFTSPGYGEVRQRNISLVISACVGVLGLGWFVERVFF
jgi:hydrogenase/urease accessory protein HupE